MSDEPVRRRFKTTIAGLGLPWMPYVPQYSADTGVQGIEDAVYDMDENVVVSTFVGDAAVLESISQEPDVEEVKIRVDLTTEQIMVWTSDMEEPIE